MALGSLFFDEMMDAMAVRNLLFQNLEGFSWMPLFFHCFLVFLDLNFVFLSVFVVKMVQGDFKDAFQIVGENLVVSNLVFCGEEEHEARLVSALCMFWYSL